jgi:hypothetical protein
MDALWARRVMPGTSHASYQAMRAAHCIECQVAGQPVVA